MRKPALYSRSVRAAGVSAPAPQPEPGPDVAPRGGLGQRLALLGRQPQVLWGGMAVLGVLLLALLLRGPGASVGLMQKDIDAAVLRSLTTQNLPSATARAAEKIRPSVVRVLALGANKKGELEELGEGTGVVIQDQGTVLTNLHVVQAAQTLQLVFADGSGSVASVLSIQPENDLAVLQAHTVPDDLSAATLRPSTDLRPGDGVVVVGFPFGIGPSTSAGVISGLGRSFRSPEGEQEMANMIQFDAAANPGNSGGPLVTLDGEVVGIVTGILNPTSHRTFVGIGFAVPIESAAGAAGLPPF
jgi:S1-C subfamily serine protease